MSGHLPGNWSVRECRCSLWTCPNGARDDFRPLCSIPGSTRSQRRSMRLSIFSSACHIRCSATGNLANVNFTMFEADRVPDFWIKAAGKSLLTIVPEASSFAAWVRSGIRSQPFTDVPAWDRS